MMNNLTFLEDFGIRVGFWIKQYAKKLVLGVFGVIANFLIMFIGIEVIKLGWKPAFLLTLLLGTPILFVLDLLFGYSRVE